MQTQTHAKKGDDSSSTGFGLFDSAEDYMQFGWGEKFDARRVVQVLNLKKSDVSRFSSVAESSVRYDDAMPAVVRERLEEIASTVNLVAKQFGGSQEKTMAWFKAKNPLLGDVSPQDMIRLGRPGRLRRFIIHAMTSQTSSKAGA